MNTAIKNSPAQLKLGIIKNLNSLDYNVLLAVYNFVEQLAEKEPTKPTTLHDLFGIWADDKDVDKIEDFIIQSRKSNTTRIIESFD